MRRKLLITVPAAILLLALYFMIFNFSAQTGTESGSLSYRISEKCVEIINNISGKPWNAVMAEQMATYFEHPIRKLAHFGEYAVMGMLIYTIISEWIDNKKRCFLILFIWIILSASFDEIHQLFVADRYASVLDVLLDTCGGVTGGGFIFLIKKLYIKILKRVRQ